MVDGTAGIAIPAGADDAPETAGAIGRPRPSGVAAVIAACAALALLLRVYQLSRPGYLLGVTEYDDGAMFGDALQFVSGVIPYRDFQMVQPPGSMLIMAPAALLAKVIGTARGLAVARVLTVAADTADVVLIGVLVRHRGALTAGIACGLYAVYPDALVASHTFLLEPWLNLCCLLAALALFDGNRLVGTGTRTAPDSGRASRLSDNARLVWAGVAFGFGAVVKIWALAPLGVAGLLLLIGGWRLSPAQRRVTLLRVAAARLRPAATLAGGAVLGLGVPLLPFAVMGPTGLARGVLIGQLARNSSGSRNPWDRLIDMAGLRLLPGTPPDRILVVLIAVLLIACYAWAHVAAGRHSAWLDAYAAGAAVVVTLMFVWPRMYYAHYGSFAGPFFALGIALPVGLLARGRPAAVRAGAASVRRLTGALAVVLVAGLAWAGYSALRTESAETGIELAAAADRLIPAGACVVTNGASYTVAADRFFSSTPDCPPMVDAYGTLFAMTSGGSEKPSNPALRPVIELWQTTLEHAQYVWLTSTTLDQIPWNNRLYGYFKTHFRLIGLRGSSTRYRDVPRPGLYARS